MLIDDLSQLPDLFKDGVRGVMLLHRNKDGCKGNAQRKSIKMITRNKDEWDEIVFHFKFLQECSEYHDFRIYSSVNSRSMTKAIHEFKRRQLHSDYENMEDNHDFYIDVQNRFFSCLMNPSARTTTYFLFDCDTIKQYTETLEKIPKEFLMLDYPTKNGRHIITHPFNPTGLNLDIKKDDLLFIG